MDKTCKDTNPRQDHLRPIFCQWATQPQSRPFISHLSQMTKAPRTDSETRVKMKGEKMSGSETKERKRILIEKKDSFCPNFAALEDNELCFR